MKLKIGMKVRVKTKKEIITIYGFTSNDKINMPFVYTSTMDKWLGKIVTITRIDNTLINIQEDEFNWHKDMFKSKTILSFKNLYKN